MIVGGGRCSLASEALPAPSSLKCSSFYYELRAGASSSSCGIIICGEFCRAAVLLRLRRSAAWAGAAASSGWWMVVLHGR